MENSQYIDIKTFADIVEWRPQRILRMYKLGYIKGMTRANNTKIWLQRSELTRWTEIMQERARLEEEKQQRLSIVLYPGFPQP